MSGLFFSRCSLLPIFHFYFDSLQEKLYAQLCYVTYLIDAIHPNNNFKQKLTQLSLIENRKISYISDLAMSPAAAVTYRFLFS